MLQSISPRFVRAPFAPLLDEDSDQLYVSEVEDEIFHNGPTFGELKLTAPQLFTTKTLKLEAWRTFLAKEDFLASSLAEIQVHLLNREFDFSNNVVLHPLSASLFVSLSDNELLFLVKTAKHILMNLQKVQQRIQELNQKATANFGAVKVTLKITLNASVSPYDRSRAVLKGILACKHCLAQCTESIDSESLNQLIDETVELLYDYNQALELHSNTAKASGRSSSINVASAPVQHAKLDELRRYITDIEAMVCEDASFVKECCYMAKMIEEVKTMFDGYLETFRRQAAVLSEYDAFMFLGSVL